MIKRTIRWNNSIKFRLMVPFIAIPLLVFVVILLLLPSVQERIIDEHKDRAVLVTQVAATFLDGDLIDHYLSTHEKDEQYERIHNSLIALLRKSKDSSSTQKAQ